MCWDFTNITSIEVVRIEDKPIVINGGEYDEQAGIDKRAVFESRTFQTLTETPEGYRKGTIDISRSNVTFKTSITRLWESMTSSMAAPTTDLQTPHMQIT